eukprot:scaffold84639_cov17-Tisochrysis_lutea.AAC.1
MAMVFFYCLSNGAESHVMSCPMSLSCVLLGHVWLLAWPPHNPQYQHSESLRQESVLEPRHTLLLKLRLRLRSQWTNQQ